jgi:hypothetical protein
MIFEYVDENGMGTSHVELAWTLFKTLTSEQRIKLYRLTGYLNINDQHKTCGNEPHIRDALRLFMDDFVRFRARHISGKSFRLTAEIINKNKIENHHEQLELSYAF